MEIEQKSMKIDNCSNECDRFLSIFDICQLIHIDFIYYYRFLSSIEIIVFLTPRLNLNSWKYANPINHQLDGFREDVFLL